MDAAKTGFILAASQGGTPVWVTPLIAAGAAILAAVVTAFSSAYVARRKVAELELSNSFELAKQYLESARNYTQTVYLPLATDMYKLHSAFLAYKATVNSETGSARDPFLTACNTFISTVDNLFLHGAAAVLTLRLDEDTTSFVSFLRESLTTQRVVKTRSLLATMLSMGVSAAALVTPLVGAIPTSQLLELGVGPAPRHAIAAAPIASDEFEKQFALYANSIKAGIKQVMLGGYKEQ